MITHTMNAQRLVVISRMILKLYRLWNVDGISAIAYKKTIM